MKAIFKSINPIEVTTDRGIDFIQIEGTVIEEKDNRVYLKGLMFDFNISKKDFETRNNK